MTAPDPLAPFLEPLERLAFPYCVTVILRKLEYLREGGSDKHVRDIRFVLAATPIDRAFVETEVARLGAIAQWRRCQE